MPYNISRGEPYLSWLLDLHLAMAEFKQPKNFVIGSDVNPAKKWRDWTEIVELYMDIQTHTYTENQKVSLL